jgi:enamine deaminase RidA (YjgF/YER057c/UK114 family)
MHQRGPVHSPGVHPCHFRDRKQAGFVAGQVADDDQGNLVGPGDLAAQARQAFANVGRALAAGGARPEQVTKITIFVAGDRREYLPAIEAGRVALFGDHKPAGTLVGAGGAVQVRLPDRG